MLASACHSSSLVTRLLLLLAAIGAVSAAPFQCGNDSRTLTEMVGGRQVTQRLRLAATAMHGCQWILDGGSFTRYTMERGDEALDDADVAGSAACQSVLVTGGVNGGSWTAEAPKPPPLDPRLFGKCRHRLSVDCRYHLTLHQGSDRACPYVDGDPVCPEGPRQLSITLGGRQVAHTWIQLDLVSGNASSCAWVLLGSSHSLWTLASEAGHGQACITCSRRSDNSALDGGENSASAPACSAPSGEAIGGPPMAAWGFGCQRRLGPDCRVYAVDAADAALPCRVGPSGRSAAAAVAANQTGSDAGFRMLMSDDKSSVRPRDASALATGAALVVLLHQQLLR